jgi:hypothetical protein
MIDADVAVFDFSAGADDAVFDDEVAAPVAEVTVVAAAAAAAVGMRRGFCMLHKI